MTSESDDIPAGWYPAPNGGSGTGTDNGGWLSRSPMTRLLRRTRRLMVG